MKRTSIVGLLLAATVCVPSTAAAEAVLTPAETQTASAIVETVPGTAIDATVVPAGCAVQACEYAIHSATPPPPAAESGEVAQELSVKTPTVLPLAGASIKDVHVRKIKAKKTKGKGLATRAVTIRSWTINDDHVCSVYSCTAWEIQLNSKAYCDGSHAWGTDNHYGGYAGYADTNGTKSVGYSISGSHGFQNQWSYGDMYAFHDATVSVVAKGVPAASSHYVHRHYPGNCGNAWLVTG